jgi:glucose-1-phosphate thymidylyltransferase
MNDWRRASAPPTRRKAILLAAGSGTRLHPMTLYTSKQLLPVYDKPLIYYPLSVLMLAGIRDILVITTDRDQHAFQQLLGDGSQWGVDLSYATQSAPNGLPEAYTVGENFLDGAPSMMILGDNILYGARLAEDVRRAAGRADGATAFAYRVRDPERFGVVVLDDADRPVELLEKPTPSPSPWAVIGLYLMDGDAPRRVRGLQPSARGELEITDLLRSYLTESNLGVELLGRGVSWLDTGTPRALLQAAQFVEVLQERQGLQVACPEEIAFRMGLIGPEQLDRLAARMGRTQYGQYLAGILAETRRVRG